MLWVQEVGGESVEVFEREWEERLNTGIFVFPYLYFAFTLSGQHASTAESNGMISVAWVIAMSKEEKDAPRNLEGAWAAAGFAVVLDRKSVV